MKPIEMLVDAGLKVEKLRVAAQVRQTHLGLRDREDKLTDELLERVQDLEKWIDDRTADMIQAHPAYPWFSRVKGVGRENIAKVIGRVDIEKADTISALWRFCGYSVENGVAPKRTRGEVLHYNSNLRSMCWRLGSSLLKTRGKFYEYYLVEKDKYVQKYENQGIKVMPTPSGAWMCDNCGASWNKKRDIITACCGAQNIIKKMKEEPSGVIWLGHVHYQALRKMIKLFLACLWLTWREMEGLPVTKPYAIDKLHHNSFIDPWEMVDREEE